MNKPVNTTSSTSSTMPLSPSAVTSQHLRDFKLAIEFKHLMKHAPGGVYLLPELKNIHRLHGVIFVRKGLYRDGIFRFVMILPHEYNSINTHPEIFFTGKIFNPLIHEETGKLDLTQDESMREWLPDRNFILTALTFLKKSFYMKTFSNFPSVVNEKARNIFDSDRKKYVELVQQSIKESLKSVYDVQDPLCTLLFTEFKPAHDVVRENILSNAKNTHLISDGDGTDMANVAGTSEAYYNPNEIEDEENRIERHGDGSDDENQV